MHATKTRSKPYTRQHAADTLKDQDPESQMLPFVTQYLAGTDISTGCPYAMTHPVALVIKICAQGYPRSLPA